MNYSIRNCSTGVWYCSRINRNYLGCIFLYTLQQYSIVQYSAVTCSSNCTTYSSTAEDLQYTHSKQSTILLLQSCTVAELYMYCTFLQSHLGIIKFCTSPIAYSLLINQFQNMNSTCVYHMPPAISDCS